jgi:DnaJ-class molecular chaperone
MLKTRKCSRCHGTGKHGPVTRAEGRCYQCSGTGKVAYSGERKKRQTTQEHYDELNAKIAAAYGRS